MRRFSLSDQISMDIWLQIFDHLPSSDLRSCRLVSHAFFHAELLHRKSLRVKRPEGLALLRRYPSLEDLDLSACASVNDRFLTAAVGSGGFKLRKVDLSRAGGVGWRGLKALVAACPRLEKVDLSHCVGVGDLEVTALAAATRLKELVLVKCLKVTDLGLAKVAAGCPGLEKLVIKWCMKVTDIGIGLVAKTCRDLKFLDISFLQVTDLSLLAISRLRKLEVLLMVHCCFVDDDGLEYLNNGCNSLKRVDLSRCESVSSAGLTSIIEGHKGLQKLVAGYCFLELSVTFLARLIGLKDNLNTLVLNKVQVSTSSLKIISASCKNLVEIGLGRCSVKDDGIAELVTNCTGLRKIDLTCCSLLTDNALLAIATHCERVESLRLEACHLFTEKGLDHIGSSCSFLQEIDLTDCKVNDTALNSLSRCSDLKVLKLGFCPDISDKGISHIGFNCKELQELDLYRCTEITNDGLFALVSGCTKLKKLNVCYCTQITDDGMKHVSSLKDLVELELRGLVGITGMGITSIAIGCKNLLQLDLKRCSSVDDIGLAALAQYSENLRQIVLSYCPVTDVGLCLLMNHKCIQDVKLVHLSRVTVLGFEVCLRVSCDRLKKLKIHSCLREKLTPVLVQRLQSRGCRVRWVNKPWPLIA